MTSIIPLPIYPSAPTGADLSLLKGAKVSLGVISVSLGWVIGSLILFAIIELRGGL